MAQQLNAQQMQQLNMINRQRVLMTGISMIKRLQPITANFGDGIIKIPLLRMGIMTGVLLQVTVPVVIATAPAVPSPVAPWNIGQVVSYVDFAGVSRTRTHGFQLWAAQSMKQGDALSAIPASNYATGAGPSLNAVTNVLNMPTAVGAGEITFSIYLPMAYDPDSDLTGAVLTQTNVGEHYVNFQLPASLVAPDPWVAPYISGAVTSGGATRIEAFQYYIQPQSISDQDLPFLDLSTVYGFEGAIQNSANIVTGNSVYMNYPNNRSVLSALFNYENGSTFNVNGSDVNGIILQANSNTNFREMSPRLIKETMRNVANSDLPGGSYFLSSRRQPIMTQLYANVQARFDLGTVIAGGSTQIVSQFEVQYASGAPLPGITVAS